MIRAVLFDFGGVIATEGFHDGLVAIARSRGSTRRSSSRSRARRSTNRATSPAGIGAGLLGTGAAPKRHPRERCGTLGRMPRSLQAPAGDGGSGPNSTGPGRPRGHPERPDGLAGAARRAGALLPGIRPGLQQFPARQGKRDPSLFDDAVRELGVAPAAAVFIDDDPGNVSRAAGRGLHALLFRDEPSLRRDLGALLGADLERGTGS